MLCIFFIVRLGSGYSAGYVTGNETTRFAHTLAQGTTGVMNHLWLSGTGHCADGFCCSQRMVSTGPPGTLGDIIFRYYVDNETTPSLEFDPYMAVSMGFNDSTAPWGTKW